MREKQKEENQNSTPYHIPVLLHESIEALQIRKDGIYVDATFGGGGHSRAILGKLETGHLFYFDQDPDAAKNVIEDPRCTFIPQNFRHMQKYLRLNWVKQVDGILADLGVSSHQFDEEKRGFSIRYDAPLDMRMNQNQSLTARDVLNSYSEKKLQFMFGNYGEVRNAKQLAAAIRAFVSTKQLKTTGQLVQIASSAAKGDLHKYLAQVFQAVRMEVNDETGALKQILEASVQLLKPGGRIVVISYHSLEDRMVKNMLRTGNVEGDEQTDQMGRMKTPFAVITKKPLSASAAEVKRNARSRSAKMRVGERTINHEP